jgi:hypothetical protein
MKLYSFARSASGPGLFDNVSVILTKETMSLGSLFLHIGIDQLPVNLPSQGKLPENLLELGCG